MNNLFYIKNINNVSDKYFKIDCSNSRFFSNTSDDIINPFLLDSNTTCYSQLYSNQVYKVDLTTYNISCNPPYSPSSSYTYRTYKIVISQAGYITITKPICENDFYIYYHNSSVSYLGSSLIYGSNNLINYSLRYFSTAGTYYITFRQRYSYNSFITGAFYFSFLDAGTNDIVNDLTLTKYKDTFTEGKKQYIIYKDEKYNLDYYIDYDEIFTGQYNIKELVFKFPDNVKLNENTLYPTQYEETESNTTFSIDINDVTNSCNIGFINENNNIYVPNFKFTIEYKNKHTLYNYYLLKDVLFSTYDTTANLKCNIYFDSTIIYKDIIIGDYNQFVLNLYILAVYDVNKVYYELQYSNNNSLLCINNSLEFFNGEATIPLINSTISNIIQNDENQNCLIFDKYLSINNDTFNILNVKQTFKKYFDLINYNELFVNKKVDISKNIDLSYLYENIITNHIFSINGYYNKINDNIYSLIQYNDTDAINLDYMNTKFIILTNLDGTVYNEIKNIQLGIDISDTTINDSIYYGDNKQYIELLKNEKIISIYIDIDNNEIYYQGNLDYVNSLDGLKYFPIKSRDDKNIYLSRLGKDKLSNDIYKIIYNYKLLEQLFNGEYTENLIEDVNCPYTNIYISDDKNYLIFYLNNDQIINNLNNKKMINLSSNTYYLNYNNSINNYYSSEVLKIDNEFFEVGNIDSDNIIVENNYKLDNTIYEPVIAYDKFDINLLNSVKELENNIYYEKEVIVLLTQKNNYLLNYPKDIMIYKDKDTFKFNIPSNMLNSNIDFIDKYYKIKRFIMKNKSSNILYIYNL